MRVSEPMKRATMRGAPIVAVPGKVFLVGEYAVLEGGRAVLGAVAHYATGQFIDGLEPESPLVAEAVRAAAFAIGDHASALPYGSVKVDTDAFAMAGAKLGIGSSAAAAVASVGAVFETAGLPVEDNRELIFQVADDAHRAAQGGVGSGADVAAVVHGGYVQFVRPPGGAALVTPLEPVRGLHVVLFASGEPSSTPDMVQAVRAFADASHERYASIMEGLRGLADWFVQACRGDNAADAVSAARTYGEGLVELGAAAKVPIVTPPFRRAAELALALGGAAKPSGAGGGDMGVALFADAGAAAEFGKRAPAKGLKLLVAGLDFRGMHRRLAGRTTAVGMRTT